MSESLKCEKSFKFGSGKAIFKFWKNDKGWKYSDLMITGRYSSVVNSPKFKEICAIADTSNTLDEFEIKLSEANITG